VTQNLTELKAAALTIQNNKGVELPSTGGIGTTIFYVVGGVLVLAAIILLVTKKRMSE
jgi:LPXTG-motif cell wall-anchored protein